MTAEELHAHVKRSLHEVVGAQFNDGVRALLESGSAEAFLVNLLFLSLRADRNDVSREYPLKGGEAVDLVVHGPLETVIEAKQLHLKDDCRFAPPNLAADLRRHEGRTALGVIYVVDDRSSVTDQRFKRFDNANRKIIDKTARVLDDVVAGLKDTFNEVTPSSLSDSRLRAFDGLGGLLIYAFVVSQTRACVARAMPSSRPMNPG